MVEFPDEFCSWGGNWGCGGGEGSLPFACYSHLLSGLGSGALIGWDDILVGEGIVRGL